MSTDQNRDKSTFDELVDLASGMVAVWWLIVGVLFLYFFTVEAGVEALLRIVVAVCWAYGIWRLIARWRAKRNTV